MATESDIDSSIVIQLTALGWNLDPKKTGRDVFRQSPKTAAEKSALGRLRPDYILYADAESGRPSVVIEAKKPNKTLVGALEQGTRYAKLLGAPIVIATDGYRLKTWHLKKQAPLFFNNMEVDELFGKKLALHFLSNNVYESFSEQERVSKKDLIAKFRVANDILRGEGLDAGIVRFSEFANLMFLKLRLEDGGQIAGHRWPDIEEKEGRALLSAVKSMFASLNCEHPGLFEMTKITSPQNMEKLVGILSSFRLSGVRDDIKGMAFEYFIHSYTRGIKSDLGQYFTPRHIIKLMVNYLKPEIGETIYDPFCGTGGMLIECFRYLSQRVESVRDKKILRESTVYGRDNSSVSRIARMNMIMFGDGHSNVEQGDSYARLDEMRNKHDIVITNIPFSQETAFTEGYPVAPLSLKESGDSIGVQHCLESLKNSQHARAAIIVPIGFIHKESLKNERERVFNDFNLENVVELTPKCFNPYTEQQTAILMLRRRPAKSRSVVYYKVRNDGFSQDGYRVPVGGVNDIDRVMEGEGGRKITVTDDDGWKYKKISIVAPKMRHALLGELAQVQSGDSISPKTQLQYITNGEWPILMVADLAAAHIDYYLDQSKYRINDTAVEEKNPFLFPANTIVIPVTGKAALLNHRAILGKSAYLSSTLAGIVAKKVDPCYLFYFMLRLDAEDIVYDLGYPGLRVTDIQNIPIPLHDSKTQKSIVARVKEIIELHKQFKEKHRRVASMELAE